MCTSLDERESGGLVGETCASHGHANVKNLEETDIAVMLPLACVPHSHVGVVPTSPPPLHRPLQSLETDAAVLRLVETSDGVTYHPGVIVSQKRRGSGVVLEFRPLNDSGARIIVPPEDLIPDIVPVHSEVCPSDYVWSTAMS